VEGDWFALSNGEAHWLTGHEAFQRVGAAPDPASGGAGPRWSGDLFS
jgi:hypothetical protein